MVNYTKDHPEPFFNGPGRPKKKAIRDDVEETLENKGKIEALKVIMQAVARDFDEADSAEARSTLARTLGSLINNIRLLEAKSGKEKPKEDDQPDMLDQLRKKKAEGS